MVSKFIQMDWLLQIFVIVLVCHQALHVKQAYAKSEQNVSNQKSACYVNEYESHEKRKCQFPFSINDKLTGETKTFHGCTTFR